MIKKIAYYQNSNSEEANIDLAVFLVKTQNEAGIKEIVEGLKDKNPAVQADCIKVLYEVGKLEPQLIENYAAVFLELLSNKNNRLIWGAMTALASISFNQADYLFKNLKSVLSAYYLGSVITVDQAVSVLAGISKANQDYEATIFPLLLKHLNNCRAKEIPQHAKRILVCINKQNQADFIEVLEKRKAELSPASLQRLNKILKRLNN